MGVLRRGHPPDRPPTKLKMTGALGVGEHWPASHALSSSRLELKQEVAHGADQALDLAKRCSRFVLNFVEI